MAAFVYALAALASLVCADLLRRQYRRTPYRLLLFSVIGFGGLALNNALLFVDVVLVPDVDLGLIRTLPAVLGLGVMVWGFIWEGP